MTAHVFKLAFTVSGPMEGFEDNVLAVAEELHNNQSLIDVSVGVNLADQRVEMDLGAIGATVRESYSTVARAAIEAIEAAGGQIESYSFPLKHALDGPAETLPGMSVSAKGRWFERHTELVEA